MIDVSAADMLGDLYTTLDSKNIGLRIAHPTEQVVDVLKTAGLEEKIGPIDTRVQLGDIVDEVISGIEDQD
jgi:anti-anti-sigma regulatory factor